MTTLRLVKVGCVDHDGETFAGVYGVPEDERAEKQRWALAFAGLEGKEKLLTGSLPGGWKQRVALGSAIMHEPSVLFLDEPTSGIDPLARRAFWRVINRLADRGTAILITTHYLEEAEQCNRLGFMVAGELVAEGTPSEIKRRQAGHLLEFTTDNPQRSVDVLKETMERWKVSLFGDRLHVVVDDTSEAGIQDITQRLLQHDVHVLGAREERFSLEDVFIGIVEKARLEFPSAKPHRIPRAFSCRHRQRPVRVVRPCRSGKLRQPDAASRKQ